MIEVLSMDELRFLNCILPFDRCVVLVVGCEMLSEWLLLIVLSVDVLRFLNYILPFDECVTPVLWLVRCFPNDCCSRCSHWTTRVFEIALAFRCVRFCCRWTGEIMLRIMLLWVLPAVLLWF